MDYHPWLEPQLPYPDKIQEVIAISILPYRGINMEQTTKHEDEKHILITTLLMQGEDSPIMKQIYKERCNRFHQYQPQSGYSIVKSY